MKCCHEICNAITAEMQADCNCFQGWGKQKALFTAQWFVNNGLQITAFAFHEMVGDSRWAAGVESKRNLSQSMKRERGRRDLLGFRETESQAGMVQKWEIKRQEWTGLLIVFIHPESFWGKLLDESSAQLALATRPSELSHTWAACGEEACYSHWQLISVSAGALEHQWGKIYSQCTVLSEQFPAGIFSMLGLFLGLKSQQNSYSGVSFGMSIYHEHVHNIHGIIWYSYYPDADK